MDFAELSRRYGTPAYVYDLAGVRAAHARLRAVLPEDALLYYSLKANPHPALVAQAVALGCGAEVSSMAELDTALGAGAGPDRCLYSGPAKGDHELEYALRRGLTWFVAESATDAHRIEQAAARVGAPVDVAIRLNPPWSAESASLAMTGGPSQFGIDLDQVIGAGDRLIPPGVRDVGLHVFLGSNVTQVDQLAAAVRTAAEAAVVAAGAIRRPIRTVNLGGGFPAPYATDGPPVSLAAAREPILRAVHRLREHPGTAAAGVAFESGRYLVGTAGSLLTRVMDVKHSYGRRMVLVDSGIHHLGGMHGLRRLHGLSPTVERPPEPPEPAAPAAPATPATLAGPLCTPLDRWIDRRAVPEVAVGDLLRVPNVGAYGLTASLIAFLSRDTAREVVVDGDEVLEVSRIVLQRRQLTEEVP